MRRFNRGKRSPTGARRAAGGFIFVQTLVVVLGLVALMTMLAVQQHQSMIQVQNRLDSRRAEMAADAAIARALGSIDSANQNLVTLNDNWALLGSNGTESFDFGTGQSFRVQVVDASSRINLNATTTAQQTQLQQELQALPLTQQQIDCLLDWIEPATQPRSDGAKDQFYNALPQPYNTKLGPLTTVDELLLVDNWTAQTLYAPPTSGTMGNAPLPTDAQGNVLPLIDLFTVDSGAPNTQASGSARTNFATGVSRGTLRQLGLPMTLLNTGPPANRTARYTNFAGLLAARGLSTTAVQQLLNIATFSAAGTRTTGKVNINSAPQAVLEALPNMTTAEASTIVGQQSSSYSSLGTLATTGGLSTTQIRQIADYLTVGSDTWEVRAYGVSNGIGCAIDAVVGLRNGQAEVITRERLNTSGIPSWWDWQAQATATEDPGATQ
jgi:general secretion pathway protein K